MSHASSQTMERLIPAFVRKPVPVSAAADAIERAVLKRAARTWAPRYVGAALASRGWMQPLAEQRTMRSRLLPTALEQARTDALKQDAKMGISGVARELEAVR